MARLNTKLMFQQIFLLIIILLFTPSSSAVLGIDFGSDRIKVAAVVPGRSFDIVLDEASKRSHPSLVVFDDDVRQYGTSASSLVAKRPLNSFIQFNRLLGKQYDTSIIDELKSFFIFNSIVRDDTRNTIRYVSPYYDESKAINPDKDNNIDNTIIDDDGNVIESDEDDEDEEGTDILNIIASEPTITVEEIMTMKLKHIKNMAEKETESDIKDCVISVPEFWSYKERQSLLDASQMAGLNVLGLINENTAAALQYALKREYEQNKTEVVLFYNMGATSTKANIVKYFKQEQTKKQRKSKKVNAGTGAFEVIAQEWDETLGSMNFDRIIANIVIERSFKSLNERSSIKQDFTDETFLQSLRVNPRFTARIRNAAARAKKILSANTDTFVSIEGIYEDEDFSTTVTRTELYDESQDQFNRVRVILDNLVAKSGFDKEDIDSIVLVGGGTRIPKVRSILTDYLEKPLKEDLNADEAPALGAAFRAANLSSTFRVRSVGMDDITSFPVGVRLQDLFIDENQEKSFKKRGSLFGPNNNLFRRRAVTLKHSKDLKVTLFYEKTARLPMDTTREIATYEITGIPKAIKKYHDSDKYNITELPKISLSFLLDANGIVDLVQASASFTEWITEEKLVEKPKKTKKDKDKDTTADADADKDTDTDKSDDADKSEDAGKSDDTDTATDTDKSEDDTEKADDDTDKPDEDDEDNTDVISEMVARKRTHRYELTTQRFGPSDVKSYSNADFARSAKLLLELDERDRSVRETADARNELESYIFESRSRLYEEKNVQKVTTDTEREEFIAILTEAEDWIWEVEEESSGIYKSKIRELKKTGNPLFLRADEINSRPQAIDTAGKTLGQLYESVEMLRINYTWINATEIDKLANMTKKVETWLNIKIEEQDEKTLLEQPVFYSYEVYYKIEPIVEYAKKLLSRPKPYDWGKKKKKKNATNTTSDSNKTTDDTVNVDGDDDLTTKIDVDGDGEEANDDKTDDDDNDQDNEADESEKEDL